MLKYLLILFSIVMTGGYMIILKNYANDTENNHPLTLSIYNGFAYGITGILLGLTYFISNTWTYDPIVWYAFVGGIFANVGGLPYILAMPKVQGSVLQPLIGMTYPLIAIGGLFLFHEPVTTKVICGIACGFIAIYLFSK